MLNIVLIIRRIRRDTAAAIENLLLETGDDILLESSSYLLME